MLNRSAYGRARRLLAASLLALALALLLAAVAQGRSERGRAARTLSAKDEAHLHYVGESGSTLIEEGSARGRLPGVVRVRFNVGATVTASFVIYTRGGTISGHGWAALHSSSVWASFGGTMSVTHGTGRYSHAHGTGGFYGVINRDTYAVTVQTTGTLSY